MKPITSLTVFFPAFNDAKILPYLICKVYALLPSVTDDFEVIIVDDGSRDETRLIAGYLTRQYPNLKIVRHPKNRGYGGALISGFKNASKDWVFYTDGDGQYDPCELSKLIAELVRGVDVVNGYKRHRQDTLIRKALGYGYNLISRRLYRLPIADVDCDFRLIRRSLLKKIKLSAVSGLICLELIVKLREAGAVFAQAAVTHHPRPFGASEFFRPKHLWRSLKEYAAFFRSMKSQRKW